MPVDHVLLAATIEDITELREQLAGVSADAYGQVLVELPIGEDLPELHTPLRMSVHRVDAHAYAPGAALVTAVNAWKSEWLSVYRPDDHAAMVWMAAGIHARDAI